MNDETLLEALTFAFDRDELSSVADRLRGSYASADPFPHVMIDDFLPASVIDCVLDEFPEHDEVEWQRFAKPTEMKLALADTSQMGVGTRNLLAQFNSQTFVEFVTRLTSIEGLIVDHTLSGGGLHQIRRGGFLRVHADFNRHAGLRLDRRINALLYFNRDWESSYGGELELWNHDMSQKVRSYAPVCNRLVVFSTTDNAFHGHPDPLTCPADRARRSMALYYYSNGRPEDEVADPHTTLFHARPGERFSMPIREAAVRWIPPALVDIVRRRRR